MAVHRAVRFVTASRRARTCGESVGGEAGGSEASSDRRWDGGGGGGGGGILTAREVVVRERLIQPCHTLTPGSLQRGHFHFDVSGAGCGECFEAASLVEGWEGVRCGHVQVE